MISAEAIAGNGNGTVEFKYDSPDKEVVVVGNTEFVSLVFGALSINVHPAVAEDLRNQLNDVIAAFPQMTVSQ